MIRNSSGLRIDQGNTFTGVADVLPAEYCMHEYGKEEEAIRLGDFVIYRSQMQKVEILPTYLDSSLPQNVLPMLDANRARPVNNSHPRP